MQYSKSLLSGGIFFTKKFKNVKKKRDKIQVGFPVLVSVEDRVVKMCYSLGIKWEIGSTIEQTRM